MNEQVKASAKVARDFLQMVAEGIGRLEGGASEFARAGAAHLKHRLPVRMNTAYRPSRTLSTLVVAGVVATTAVLIYSRTRAGKEAMRKARRQFSNVTGRTRTPETNTGTNTYTGTY
jgi:hypothetical protein